LSNERATRKTGAFFVSIRINWKLWNPGDIQGGNIMPSETRLIAAEVPNEIADRVEQLAEQRGRTPASVIEEALSCWIDQEDESARMTLEALAEVDAGLVVDDEDVRAWVESLGTENPLPMPVPKT
jgi:predicted transcriptional regulator